MINKYNWIFFCYNAKQTFTQRALAERLAEMEPVVIIDRPVSVLRDRKILSLKVRHNCLPGGEASYCYRPLHYPERLPGIGRILQIINRRLLQQELDQLLPRNGSRLVCFDSPTQDHLVKKLGEDLSIYLANDDKTLTVWGDSIPGELEAEKRLLSKVDKVICVSEILANTLRSRKSAEKLLPIHVLPNGYDERIFDPNGDYIEPSFLANIPRPRILVAGHISERIDWNGIIEASKLRQNWNWIFIGFADPGMKERITSTLGAHGFYHSPISIQDVPAWIQHCDVCAVPYRLNPFTRASNPLKAIEYLAMGAPVLSTRVPALQRFDGVIEWVEVGNGQSYTNALDKLIQEGNDFHLKSFRKKAVAGETWQAKTEQFRRMVIDTPLTGNSQQPVSTSEKSERINKVY